MNNKDNENFAPNEPNLDQSKSKQPAEIHLNKLITAISHIPKQNDSGLISELDLEIKSESSVFD